MSYDAYFIRNVGPNPLRFLKGYTPGDQLELAATVRLAVHAAHTEVLNYLFRRFNRTEESDPPFDGPSMSVGDIAIIGWPKLEPRAYACLVSGWQPLPWEPRFGELIK